MIDTTAELEHFLPALRQTSWVALDTEADSLHSYPEKLCLIQVSIPLREALIDPLAAGLDLAPLWEALRGKELILHGGDYDLRLLHQGHGFVPDQVFDTLNAARLLGRREFGLHHLVKGFLGIELAKGSQKANWSKRPLTPKMIRYALADARYLKPLRDCLRQRLVECGRLEWHAQMCRQLIAHNTRPPTPPARPPWQIRGASRLSPRGLAVLREVWRWRDREAVAANRPPFFVLDHDRLLRIAERAAVNDGFVELIPKRYSSARRRALIRAVEAGMGVPEHRLPQLHRERGRRMSEAQKRRFEELRERRDQQAKRLGLDPTLIASKSTLSAVVLARDPREHLLPWQADLLLEEQPRPRPPR
jgi:ribonuclease D